MTLEPDCQKCGESGSWYSRSGQRVRTRSRLFKKLSREQQYERLNGAVPLCTMHAKSAEWSNPESIGERICANPKHDAPMPMSMFHRRGTGFHSWCKDCVRAYHEVRKKLSGGGERKTKAWMDYKFWEGQPHEELMKEYEEIVARSAVMMVSAVKSKSKAYWAAYYRLASKRDEVRSKVVQILK